NRATVALAYEELVAAGWARAHVGQGTFVAGPPAGAAAPAAPPAARPLNWSALLSRSARIVESDGERARAAAPGAVRDGVISFAGGMPDSGLFPTDAFRRALNEVVREEGESLLQYYPVGGDPPRRRGGAAGGGGATPGAGRRGRLRRQSLLWRAAAGAAEGPRPRRRGGLHRDVLEGAVPRAAPRLARGAAAAGRAPPRRQAARGPAHERAHPGGGPPLLRATAARSPRGPHRRRV